MNYKEAFAVNEVAFNKLSEDNQSENSKYQLNNFDFYEPKLIEDFYLKYFMHDLLIKTDILELREFLEYHYDYCDAPEKYYSILDVKIIPKIEELVDNAQPNLNGRGYYDEKPLEYGFIESEGVIKNWDYDYPHMMHLAGWNRLQNDFKKRIQIIHGFIDEYKNNAQPKLLNWKAGPSQLAIIIRELIDKGYMEADMHRGEINNSKLSRELFKAFSINDCDTSKSIEIYLSPNNKKYKQAKETFDNRGFNIPDAKFT
ncbi:hypothetical protein L3X39_13275 [Sabulilitoribacter multivorans]|uniref:Uncharacterized protein n=1 Tax=Flaviramulus multivorans TaxID=1304750 RepID=A0ABS9IM31_9FLAO|nr:hypothetical protein [Flaviramulus multivorans]MCF7561612.1 hypothetical protein [Flaviramulus multivorans]